MDFIVAGLVLAVFFADRIGAPEDIRRRMYQVVLALTLAILAAAIAALAVPVTGITAIIGPNPPSESPARHLREQSMVSAAIGLGLLLIGFLQARRWPTLYLGLVLGGAVILVSSLRGVGTGTPVTTLLYDTSGSAGTTLNAMYAAILALGSVALLAYGYQEWEREPAAGAETDLIDS